MKSTKKLNAVKNKVVGTVKTATGKLVGNKALEAKGKREHAKGQIQSAAEDLKGAVHSVME